MRLTRMAALVAIASCGGGGGGTEGPAEVAGSVSSPTIPVANLQVLNVTDVPSDLPLASEAGAQGVRATPNIGWHGIEPMLGGPYHWANADGAQQAVDAYGFSTLRIVSSTRPEYNAYPQEYKDNGYLLPHLAPDTGMDLWEQYKKCVRAVVRRYCKTAGEGNPDAMPGLRNGVRIWSYTPEVGTFWVPIPDPVRRASDYAAMFQLTYDAIHEVDPGAVVLLPFNGSPYLAAFVGGFLPRGTIDYHGETNLTREQVEAEHSDAVAFAETLLDLVRPDGYDLHLYGDAESIPGQRAWLSVNSPAAKPVYSMEGGEPYGGLGETIADDAMRLEFQSGAMVQHFALAFSSGFGCVTFNLSSEYATFGSWFGDLDLLDANAQPRPAYYTYQLAVRKLVPFVSAAEATAPADARLFRFRFASRADVWVAWDTTGAMRAHDLNAMLGFSTARVTHAVTVARQETPWETIESASAIQFGAVPVFVEERS